MNEKQIPSRTHQLSDTESNWLLVPAFVPKLGELVVFNADENYEYPRVKIGDGVTPLIDLPFAYENRNIVVEDDDAGVVYIQLGVDELPAQNAAGWANATIVVTSLASGAEATVSVATASDGHKVITLGIPKGDTGATGSKGDKGEKGDKGDTGATGASGYTPVRGTDYWTTADKNEIITSASTISGAAEGSIVSTDSSGKMVASSRTIASLGTGATYSLSDGTLTITTL